MSFFFQDMFGGMPGGGGGHYHEESDEDEGASDTNRFYTVLGVDKNASEDEIKKAYKKKAKMLHPDRHPTEKEKYQELFHEAQTAYETLTDPDKRQIYDKYGEKGLKRGGGGGAHSMDDVLSQFFGNGMGRGQRREYGRKQSPAIKKVLDVTLEDLYIGALKKIKIERSTAASDSAECARCHGSGAVTVTQRMGPMMIQQRAKCSTCNGQGYQLSSETVEVEVHIPIGGRHGETVTLNGEGNKYPGHEAGDVIFQLRQEKHSVFTRKGADLGMSHTLSLREALCGYKIKIDHVSGHSLIVESKAGEIVQPGSLKRIYSYGMPIRYQAHTKGHLYIAMDVKLPPPNSLGNAQLEAFRKILPDIERDEDDIDMDEKESKKDEGKKGKASSSTSSDKTGDNDEEEETPEPAVYIEEVDAYDVDDNPKATPASARSTFDEDEDGQNVQCRHM